MHICWFSQADLQWSAAILYIASRCFSPFYSNGITFRWDEMNKNELATGTTTTRSNASSRTGLSRRISSSISPLTTRITGKENTELVTGVAWHFLSTLFRSIAIDGIYMYIWTTNLLLCVQGSIIRVTRIEGKIGCVYYIYYTAKITEWNMQWVRLPTQGWLHYYIFFPVQLAGLHRTAFRLIQRALGRESRGRNSCLK